MVFPASLQVSAASTKSRVPLQNIYKLRASVSEGSHKFSPFSASLGRWKAHKLSLERG